MFRGATMFRQSPSRNQRSKGFKVKHGLQIFLLLAVCLWLLYQVKHSHDKKKAFDESTSELVEKFGNQQEILKLGRKDLHPQVEEITVGNERHSEEEVEEENKHEEEVEEEEESKPEESEEEGRGGGDDEIDEQDQEREDEETDRKEDFIDEEDKENEEKENQGEETDSSDDQDHDRNTQEAREENYKGDDASSAVARDSQISNTEAGSGESGNRIEDKNQLDPENGSNSTKEATSNSNDSNQITTGVGNNIDGEGDKSLNVTAGEAAPETKLPELADESQSNSTSSTESNNQSEVKNNSTAGIAQAPPTLPLLNGTSMNSGQAQDQNREIKTSSGDNSNLQTVVQEQPENNNRTTGVEQSGYNTFNENADATKAGATNSSSTIEEQPVASNENVNGAVRKSNDHNTGTREGDDGNGDAALNLSNDSRDSTILKEESESRTDLGTLPQMQNKGIDSEDAAAE